MRMNQRLEPNVTRNLNVCASKSIIESHYNFNFESPTRAGNESYLQKFREILNFRRGQQPQLQLKHEKEVTMVERLNSQIKQKIHRLKESNSVVDSKIDTINTQDISLANNTLNFKAKKDLDTKTSFFRMQQSQPVIPKHQYNEKEQHRQLNYHTQANKAKNSSLKKNKNILNQDILDELNGILQPYQ
ncbi:UNKNOWN [Stylonychia lemnae]|uniref:Uncharacterized protein n=1 Tax=Stylonychia lemnae TaxID=5949 RepID=A0A078A898_STYLE|nr:UNKNOWN [Stylonychia lemnae]|eukprot:CDW78449.1 UNKNOWN [Stylonychia lemnae]